MIKEAEALARKFHAGQLYGTKDYVDAHIAKVVLLVAADPFATREHIQIAWLHDILEDTECTVLDLEEAGFCQKVINAVERLTRQKNESYLHYLRWVGRCGDASLVKYWDSYCNYHAGGKPKYKNNMNYLAPILDQHWGSNFTPVHDAYGISTLYRAI